eukprot:1283803-Rhodomonas_salina.3
MSLLTNLFTVGCALQFPAVWGSEQTWHRRGLFPLPQPFLFAQAPPPRPAPFGGPPPFATCSAFCFLVFRSAAS